METHNREDATEIDEDLAETLDERAADVLEGDFVTPEEHEARRED